MVHESWFKVMKAKYHEEWTSWFLNDRKAFTKNGNLKSPGYARAIDWIVKIWNELDRDLMIRSFDTFGITCSNQEYCVRNQ